jgi:hypothetical protein
MKTSELIRILQASIEEHGDLEVFAWPYDGQGRHFAASVEIYEPADRPGTTIIAIEGE